MKIAVLAGRFTAFTFERLDEVALIPEADRRRDFAHQHVGRRQEFARHVVVREAQRVHRDHPLVFIDDVKKNVRERVKKFLERLDVSSRASKAARPSCGIILGMKPITTSQFSFERVIANGNVYVDKTDLLARLAKIDGGQFFISRPRRFGKSLMLSTLKAMFEGRKDLFEGLKITRTDYDWKTYPVLHLDMANATGDSVEALKDGLNALAMSAARSAGVEVEKSDDPSQTFRAMWEAVVARNLQVVVLIDEYDVPLQGYLNDPENFERVRKIMHDFYVRLKSYSGNIRFLMLTGVTKLAKLSIFSGLNNLTDLTMNADYAGLLGYTHNELKEFFAEHIAAFAESEGTTPDDIFAKMLAWYDNYRFSPRSKTRVLNPVSVGSALTNKAFGSYWISTGKSSLIVERLKKAGVIPANLDSITAFWEELDVCDAVTMPVKSLLYQSGYLTIKDVSEIGELMLGVPNAEVRNALVYDYLATEISEATTPVRSAQLYAAKYLREGKLDEAIGMFRTAIAKLPYDWVEKGKEGAVSTAFALFFYAMNDAHVSYESHSLNGRADAVVETKDAVYIFEFKYNRSAQEAFDQILANGYHLPYLNKGKPVYGIGLNFNPENGNRGIDEAVVKCLA